MYDKLLVALLLILIFQLNAWRKSVERIHRYNDPLGIKHWEPIRGAGLTPLTTPHRRSCALLFTGSDREGD